MMFHNRESRDTHTSCAMWKRGSRMAWFERAGHFRRDVLDQRAAHRHVQHLHAAADGQQRQIGFDRGPGQGDLEGVAAGLRRFEARVGASP